MVLMNGERFIGVYLPTDWRRYCKKRNLLICIFVIIAIAIVVNLHFIWTVDVSDSICYPFPPSSQSRSMIFQILTILENSLLPYSIIVILSISILYKLHLSSTLPEAWIGRIPRSRHILFVAITRMLVAMSFTFVVFVFPLRVLYFYSTLYPQYIRDKWLLLIRRFLLLLAYIFYAFNFIFHSFNENGFLNKCFKCMANLKNMIIPRTTSSSTRVFNNSASIQQQPQPQPQPQQQQRQLEHYHRVTYHQCNATRYDNHEGVNRTISTI